MRQLRSEALRQREVASRLGPLAVADGDVRGGCQEECGRNVVADLLVADEASGLEDMTLRSLDVIVPESEQGPLRVRYDARVDGAAVHCYFAGLREDLVSLLCVTCEQRGDPLE